MHLHDSRGQFRSARCRVCHLRLENDATVDHAGNAVIEALTLSLDARTAVHNERSLRGAVLDWSRYAGRIDCIWASGFADI